MTSGEKNEIHNLHGEGAMTEFLYCCRQEVAMANLDHIRSTWGKTTLRSRPKPALSRIYSQLRARDQPRMRWCRPHEGLFGNFGPRPGICVSLRATAPSLEKRNV